MRQRARSPEHKHSEEECLFTHRRRGEGRGGEGLAFSEARESIQDPSRGADEVLCCCSPLPLTPAPSLPRGKGRIRPGDPGACLCSSVGSYTFNPSRFGRQR